MGPIRRGLSIRYKFLAVTTLLLVVCVGIDLIMATHVFRKDKTEMVFDLNRSVVTNLASDLDTVFASATDKMRLAAYFFNAHDERNLAILTELFATSREIVYVGGSERFDRLDKSFFNSQPFSETYALNGEFFEKDLSEKRPIPFTRLQTEGEAIWNATTDGGPSLIGYGKSVVIEENGKPSAHYAVVAYLRADRIVKALTRGRLSRAVVTTMAGEVLVKPDEGKTQNAEANLAPLVEAARTQSVKTSVLEYRDGREEFLGAFAKAANNRLLVISKVSSQAAFAVVGQFLLRSLLVALMVLNLAFIAAILFSKSLTQPIEVLSQGMHKVSEGDLTTQIFVHSQDEIAHLAESFNGMIRELKNSREALEEINRELENKVRDRTQQLEKQNQAVKSAQEALLRTTRLAAVGEIAGRAAHEVLNPLTTIVARLERLQERLGKGRTGELDLLRDLVNSWRDDFASGGFQKLVGAWQGPSQVFTGSTLWDEDLRNLEQIRDQFGGEIKRFADDAEFLHKEAQRIGRIVQQMRSLSVAKAQRQRRDLAALVEEAANVMRDLASQSGVEIQIEGDVKGAAVYVDPDEFLQALTNLLRNSVQAVSERRRREPALKGEIRIALHDAGELWRMIIRDNGVGIAHEDQSRLFENQFSTKSPQEGTGLGLNISRRFVRAVGGDIVLESSTPGHGTTFVVTLPKNPAEEQGAA